VIVFYVSGHGLGHATRTIELIATIHREYPDLPIIVRTAAPTWIFEAANERAVLRRGGRSVIAPKRSARRRTGPRLSVEFHDVDTGVIETNGLDPDEDETARTAARFYRDFDRRADDEAAYLKRVAARVVVSDIPPLAFAASARAGIPSIALSNFTWDWIYSDYPAFERGAPNVIRRIRDAYQLASRALRLPMHGGFEPMAAVVRDIPFIARKSRHSRPEVRTRLGVASDKPVVLISFAGRDLGLPVERIASSGSLTLLQFARDAPKGLSYEDVVAAADIVLSKPGYGIISDCIANRAALLYTSRGRFIEYDVLVAEMPRYLRCQLITREELLSGRWQTAIDRLLCQPGPPAAPPMDGAVIASEEILAHV
jgi:hypothetical protein